MDNERSIDRLARYIIYLAAAAIICGVCWYFKNVIIYIIIAAVVSLIGRPINHWCKKIKIKGKRLPDVVLTIMTMVILVSLFVTVITQVIPLVSNIIRSISSNVQHNALNASPQSVKDFLDSVNASILNLFPGLGYGFRLEDTIIQYLVDTFKLSSVSSVIGSVASILSGFAIAIFSVVFISFFFIKDPMLLRKIIGGLVPDKHEKKAIEAIGSIEHLLSRYFVGLIIEIAGVTTINFLGLWSLGGLSFYNAFGIAFLAGLLNVVPYVGPLTGGVIGTMLAMLLKVSAASALGMPIYFWTWLAVIAAVFVFTQLVDNFLFQPLIYSTSIKSSPLEIFIVLLVAGHLGGIVGMLVAIPSYTVLRVIASEFFYDLKAIQRLIPGKEVEVEDKVMELFRDDIHE